MIGVFSQGRTEAEEYQEVINWFLSDFERRNMVLKDVIVKTGREPVENDAELMQRAYEGGRHLAD